MPASRDLSSGWKTYEVAIKQENGAVVTPFFDQLRTGGTLATAAIGKMQMIETLGWPEARRCLKDDKGRKIIVKKDDLVWLVKCKPSCWRLYCYVWEDVTHERKDRFIIYVLAICKKRDQEDASEVKRARRIVDDIRERRKGIQPFEFPK